jgi:hypothetical protein
MCQSVSRVRVSHVSECLTCQSVPRVRVSHVSEYLMCQSVSRVRVSHVSECLTCLSVSRYVVSVYVVYMLRMNQYECPMWSECITTCCISLFCLHARTESAYIAPGGQSVSAHIAHVVRVSQHILPHVVRVYHDMLYRPMLST